MTTTTEHPPEFSDEATVVLPRRPLPQAPQGYTAPVPGYGYGFPQGGGVPPVGPFGSQAPFGQPAPQRGPKISRNGWIGIGGAVALVVAMIVAIVAGTSAVGGSSQAARGGSAEAAQTVAPADLAGMLLAPEAIAEIVGQPGTAAMALPRPVHATPNDADVLSDPACLPVSYPAEKVAYQGSGFTAMQVQMTVARPARNEPQLWVFEQAVTSYPSAQAADAFVRASAESWKRCENASWSQRYNTGATVFWNSGTITGADGLLAVPITQENGAGWGCWRGLTAHANAVLDFAVCADNLPASVVPATAQAIAHHGRPV